ncbi:hypothetical protein BHE74_00040149, partial [Ensete ventricosum]
LPSDLIDLFLQDKTFAWVVDLRGDPSTIKLASFRRVKSDVLLQMLELLLLGLK